MTPRAVPFRGRAKWGAVAVDLTLAVLGAALAWGVLSEVPEDVVALRVLAVYTGYAVLATVVLALARSATSQLPPLRRTEVDGREAWLARSWSGDWWYAVALDLGLVLLAGALSMLGLRAGGEWLVPGLLAAAAGTWFLVRVVLSLTGRRSNEALWLTADSVVHESPWGRVRGARRSVTDVAATGRSARLVLALDGPAEESPCPRPWRSRRRRTAPEAIVVDCSAMGHTAEDLARWIELELGWA